MFPPHEGTRGDKEKYMRKKLLKAAIATFAVSLAAGLGVTFANVDNKTATPTVTAATTTSGLSSWTTSGSVTVSGGTATINAGGYIYLPVSSDYTLKFSTTRSTTGAAVVGGTRSLLIGMSVASPSTYTTGAWFMGSVDQNSNLVLNGANNTNYYGTPAAQGWTGQDGEMTLTVSGGTASLTHSVHGAAYTNFPVSTSGYVSFYVPTGAGAATLSGVTYTDNTATGGGSEGGSTATGTACTEDFADTTYSGWTASTNFAVTPTDGIGIMSANSAMMSEGTYTDFTLTFDTSSHTGAFFLLMGAPTIDTRAGEAGGTPYIHFNTDRPIACSGAAANDYPAQGWATASSWKIVVSGGKVTVIGTANVVDTNGASLDAPYTIIDSASMNVGTGYIILQTASNLSVDNLAITLDTSSSGGDSGSSGDEGSGGGNTGNEGSGTGGGTSSSEGDLINTFDGPYGYTVEADPGTTTTDGIVDSTYGVSDGTTSLKLTAPTNWYDTYLSVGEKTEAEIQAYSTITFTSYSTVPHKYYVGQTIVADVPGNTTTVVSVDIASYLSAIFVEGTYNYLKFTTLATAGTPVYVDNLRLSGQGSTGGDSGSGGDEGSGGSGSTETITGDLINGFEANGDAQTINTANATVEGAASSDWKSEGSYSNKLTSSTQWYNVNINVGTKTIEDFIGYENIAFDVYSTGRTDWHIVNTLVGTGVAGTATQIVAATNLLQIVKLGEVNYLQFVIKGVAGATVYVDNLIAAGVSEGIDGPSPSTAPEGLTQYTRFDSALNTNEWVTNAGSVSGGAFNFSGGASAYLASVGQYQNFILEFSTTGLTVAPLIIAFGGDDSLAIANAKYVQHNADGIVPVNFSGARTWAGYSYGAGITGRFRLQAHEGVVSAGYSLDGGQSWAISELGSYINTKGRIFITVGTTTSFKIDDLFIINTDKDNYVVDIKTESPQVTAGSTWTSKVDIGDTNSRVTFAGLSDGLTMDETTGEFTIKVPNINGTHEFSYMAFVSAPVLDGWIYPLGKEDYSIRASIIINVTGGINVDVEGGEGDMTYVPVISEGHDDRKEFDKGVNKDLVFTGINLKGQDIVSVKWRRSASEKGILLDSAYAYDMLESTFTLFGAYVKELPAGSTEITITTEYGKVVVYVDVVEYNAPTTEGETTKGVKQYSSSDVTFTVNLNDAPFLGIQVAYLDVSGVELKSDGSAFTWSGNTLTILGVYVKELPVATVTFTVNSKGGSVDLKIIVNALDKPEVSGADNASVKASEAKDVSFTFDLKGEALTAVVAVRGGEEKQLDASAYTYAGGTLTFNAAYVKELPLGTTSFYVETRAGRSDAGVNIVVTERIKAEVSPTGSTEVEKGLEEDVEFQFDLKGETLLSFSVVRGSEVTLLNTNAYEVVGDVFYIKAAYLAELPVGTTTFNVNTAAGSTSFTITILSATLPQILTTEKTVDQYSTENVTFYINLNGKSLLNVIVVRGGEEKALLASAYTATTSSVTIKGDYVKQLSESISIKVETESGVSNVATLNVTAIPAPTVTNASDSVMLGEQKAISFTVVNSRKDLLGVQVSRTGVSGTELNSGAYTFNKETGVFTIIADYVASLPADTTFTLNFVSGSVSVVINVTAIPGPTTTEVAPKTNVYDTANAVAFTVDVKGQAYKIFAKREGKEDQLLDATAYTYAGTTLTFKAEYVQHLPFGVTTFVIETEGGSVEVKINVVADTPVVDGIDSVSITASTSTAVQIKVDVFSSTFTLTVNKEGESPAVVEATNYSYINGILFLMADYTDTLAVGTYTFTLTNSVGSDTFTVAVAEAVVEEEPTQGSNQGSGNLWDPDFDWDNWNGDIQPNFSGSGSSGSGCGSSVGAVSSMALIGLAAVALIIKKKKD